MKAIKFKLFATIFTLAAVIIVGSFEASAQRRSSEKSNKQSTEKRRSANETRKRVEEKSNYRENDRVERNRVNRDLKSTRSTGNRSGQQVQTKSGNTSRSQNNATRRSSASPARNQQNSNTKSVQRSSNTSSNRQSNGAYRSTDRNDNRQTRVGTSTADGRRNTGRTISNNRDFYRVDKSDSRYKPNTNYRGSNNYWSSSTRSGRMNYNRNDARYYRNYNYLKRTHWDRRWESYRWNYNSWRDYYRGYNPRSYVYSKYYFRHPRYGHVLSRFDYRPLVFVHNSSQYYCYNGHFFRYRPGIGYILVDLPFGFTFRYLPAGYYDRVFINGFAYFRIGNLFFEATPYGYSLVHYPERYYAYDDGFERPGMYYDDIYY